MMSGAWLAIYSHSEQLPQNLRDVYTCGTPIPSYQFSLVSPTYFRARKYAWLVRLLLMVIFRVPDEDVIGGQNLAMIYCSRPYICLDGAVWTGYTHP